jgi:cyclin-dependent kinase-like
MQSKYEVLGVVGEGSYGIVYKSKNKKNNEYVAIKKFKEEEDDLVKKTISRELRVLQILKHENIVEFKEAFKMKGNLFLVFEYVDKNLLELLQEHPKGLDPLLIKKLVFQMCKAVKYLHDMNIVHRDIKPENLLVDADNKLKLCDFGFARTIKNTKEKLTDYVATRWYRAPELLITTGYYGPEVDYWAIGCIMGELVDGDPLFPGDNEIDQLNVVQKVIGKFEDYQYELFYNNPHFKNAKLLNVTKPETLERRYFGKLSKTAINFMKLMLHPDPKQRLNGETVFLHPYFNGLTDGVSEIRDTIDSKTPTSGGNGKPKVLQPIINNTTNINIINYNVDKEKEKSSSNMLMTSYNFNNQNQENILAVYNGTALDKNFKTFYKGDPYNFEIGGDYKKPVEKQSNNAIKQNKPNIKHDLEMYLEKSQSPKNKKKVYDLKKTNSIVFEENTNNQKFAKVKSKPVVQLPLINKNYLYSTRKYK